MTRRMTRRAMCNENAMSSQETTELPGWHQMVSKASYSYIFAKWQRGLEPRRGR